MTHFAGWLALGASAVAACAPERASTNGPGQAGDSSLVAGASGTPQGGQLGQGGVGANHAGVGGAAASGAGTGGTGGTSGGVSSGGSTGHDPRFLKTLLNPDFYSEGINHGDLDRDGKQDIIAGPYFYRGPDFAEKRAFREPQAAPFAVAGDSDCYSIFVYDLNQDEWLDVISLRVAGGAEAVWYENPKGASSLWAEHVFFGAVDNESATFADVDGDDKPELVTLSNGYGGWAVPDWTQPAQPWTFRNVTQQGDWGRYTHGMGVGDVNDDGRLDLLVAEGWWAQPANPSALPWVWHPTKLWGQDLAGESYGGAQMFTEDVDGDGDRDIITSLQAHGWGLAWFEQTDEGFVEHRLMGTRAEEAQYGVAFAQLHALDVADLNGDGLQDIVTGKRKGAHGNGLGAELDAPAVLYWFELIREPGQLPRYEPHLIDSEAGVGTQVVAADVNDDGLLDVLTAARAGAFLFLNQR